MSDKEVLWPEYHMAESLTGSQQVYICDEADAIIKRLRSERDALLDTLRDALPTLERAATEEKRANRAPSGLPPRTNAMARLNRARAAIAKATGQSEANKFGMDLWSGMRP